MNKHLHSNGVTPPSLASLLDAPRVIWQVDLVEILTLERQVQVFHEDATRALDTSAEREIYLTEIPLALAKADLEAVRCALIERLMHGFPIEPGPYTAQLTVDGRPRVISSQSAQPIEPQLHTSANGRPRKAGRP